MHDESDAIAEVDTQRYVALDLEYNQPSGTIIQVGVAIGSASQSQQEYVVRRWDLQVDEPISEFITQLTGITDEDCRAGVSLAQCAEELGSLLRQHEVFVNPVTWGGGDSTDLLCAFAQAQIEFHHFGRRWMSTRGPPYCNWHARQLPRSSTVVCPRLWPATSCSLWAKHIGLMSMRSTRCDFSLLFWSARGSWRGVSHV